MIKNKYVVITGASSGIGYEAAKAFADRGKNLIIVARRKNNLEKLKEEILEKYPKLDIVIKVTDLSITENLYYLYNELQKYELETWVNSAGFGNYASVAEQDLKKINSMLHLNIEAVTILSSLFVRDYKDKKGTKLINISSCGGYVIVPTAITYCATKFYVSSFTEGLAHELKEENAIYYTVEIDEEDKGIYLKKTKIYYNYFKYDFCSKKSEDTRNLVISKEGVRVEIIFDKKWR